MPIVQLDASQYYQIRGSNGAAVLVLRGNGAAKITAGGARYTTIALPRRTSVVQYDGNDPYMMDVPIIFDGWADERNVEDDIARVNQMAQSVVIVHVDGALPVKGAKWVIQQPIEWGDLAIWSGDKNGKGFRYRQDAVLHLLQYVPVTTQIAQVNVAAPPTTGSGGPRSGQASKNTTHSVVAGDTPVSIAAKHNVSIAVLKAANGIRDIKTIKTGQILLVPKSPFS